MKGPERVNALARYSLEVRPGSKWRPVGQQSYLCALLHIETLVSQVLPLLIEHAADITVDEDAAQGQGAARDPSHSHLHSSTSITQPSPSLHLHHTAISTLPTLSHSHLSLRPPTPFICSGIAADIGAGLGKPRLEGGRNAVREVETRETSPNIVVTPRRPRSGEACIHPHPAYTTPYSSLHPLISTFFLRHSALLQSQSPSTSPFPISQQPPFPLRWSRPSSKPPRPRRQTRSRSSLEIHPRGS